MSMKIEINQGGISSIQDGFSRTTVEILVNMETIKNAIAELLYNWSGETSTKIAEKYMELETEILNSLNVQAILNNFLSIVPERYNTIDQDYKNKTIDV